MENEPTPEEMSQAVKTAIPDEPKGPPSPPILQEFKYLPLEGARGVCAILHTPEDEFIDELNKPGLKDLVRWKSRADGLFFTRLAENERLRATYNVFEDNGKKDSLWERMKTSVRINKLSRQKVNSTVIDVKGYTELCTALEETASDIDALDNHSTQYRNAMIDFKNLVYAKMTIDYHFSQRLVQFLESSYTEDEQHIKKVDDAIESLGRLKSWMELRR